MCKGLNKKRLAILGLALLLSGCTLTDMFNEQFLASMVGGAAVTLPGNAPALLVAVRNDTDRLALATVQYRDADDALQTYTAIVQPEQSTAKALICPISEITLGDLSNPSVVGVTVLLGNETINDAYIEVEPFGVPLQEGQNYDCGDGITFVVQPSGATSSGYQTFAYIHRADDGE